MKNDIIVVGAGPGGYVCAIRAAQLGLRAALVEERALGGVCLNWGCIPTKALFSATKLIERAGTAGQMGISFSDPEIDIAKLAAWKDDLVRQLTGGIADLLDKNGVDVLHARARLAGPHRVALSDGETITAERIVLATGSSPAEIPGFSFDDPAVWSSDDALALREIPERLLIIGGGVIGLELATIYRRLGSAVTVVELLPEILSTVDLDRRTLALLKRALKSQGIDLRTGAAAEGHEPLGGGGVRIRLTGGDRIEADRVLLAVGRRPNSGDLGLESIGLRADRRGFVPVDERHRTAAEDVCAIGDLVLGPMLAHRASADGIAVAEGFAGGRPEATGRPIPQAIFTDPEIASIGISEAGAADEGRKVVVGRFPYAALGKALGMRESDGAFQVVADASDHRIIGAQVIGAEASDLISEIALAVQSGLTLEDVASTIHAHPTLPEGWKEAAEAALGRAIHAVNR